MSKLFRFLHHIHFDSKKESNVPVILYKLANSQNELRELFSFIAQEDINIISHI